MNSSFHHLLLKEDDFFCEIVSDIALSIAFMRSLVNLSIFSIVVSVFRSEERERYFYNLFFSVFQFVLMKLYDGCVDVANLEMKSRIVSIGRWLKIWLFSMIMWHFIMLFITCWLLHIKSIAVFSFENMIINCIPYWSISSINSSTCRSCV